MMGGLEILIRPKTFIQLSIVMSLGFFFVTVGCIIFHFDFLNLDQRLQNSDIVQKDYKIPFDSVETIINNMLKEKAPDIKKVVNNILMASSPYEMLKSQIIYCILNYLAFFGFILWLFHLYFKRNGTINDLSKSIISFSGIKKTQPLYFIAEVFETQKQKKLENIALVRIRTAGNDSAPDASNMSLIYEGLSYNMDGKIFYWKSSPLCIDLFALEENIREHIKLIFRTSEGEIFEFQKAKVPSPIRSLGNFGKIYFPAQLSTSIYRKSKSSSTDLIINGIFTDVYRDRTGKVTLEEKNYTMTPLIDQIKKVWYSKQNRAIVDSNDLLNVASLLIKKNVLQSTLISRSDEFISDFEEFIREDKYWQTDSIFSKFK